jgi:hypothetical protein
VIAGIGVFLFLNVAQAKVSSSDPAGWAGGLFGVSVPNADNTTSRSIYGLTAGAKIGSDLGIGGYYMSSSKDETVAGVSSKFAYDLYGVEVGMHFEGEAKGAYFGGRLGTSKVTASVAGASISTSPFHWGAFVGYNHMIGGNFSLGGDVNFFSLAQSSATPLGSTTSQTINAFNVLNFMASAKFWF